VQLQITEVAELDAEGGGGGEKEETPSDVE